MDSRLLNYVIYFLFILKEEEARRQSGSQYGSFPGGFPGEMPGMGGGIPGMAGMPGLNEILSDPEVLAAMQVRLGRTKLNFISLKHFFQILRLL